MIAATIEGDVFPPLPFSTDCSASMLRSLIRDWERDAAVDEVESETELMILLSRMASQPTVGDS